MKSLSYWLESPPASLQENLTELRREILPDIFSRFAGDHFREKLRATIQSAVPVVDRHDVKLVEPRNIAGFLQIDGMARAVRSRFAIRNLDGNLAMQDGIVPTNVPKSAEQMTKY